MSRRTGLQSGHALALGAGVLALGIAASIQAAGAVDSTDAQTSENTNLGNPATESIDSCMRKWDPGTHMSREAWRQSCARIKNERESYLKNH